MPDPVAQVWITAPGRVEVREVDLEAPAPREARVRTVRAGICGSDLHTYRHRHPWLPYPIAPGHEVAGVVEAVGEGTAAVTVGQRVFVQPAVACGSCLYCVLGKPNLCERLVGIGAHTPGGMADAFVAPEAALRPLPGGMSLLQASLVEPVATAVHALALVGGVRGASVAVLGGGTIGLAVLLAARAGGAAAVAVTELVAAKRELAGRLGGVPVDAGAADLRAAVLDALPHRPDVVFDCVATAASIQGAVELATKGGTVVVVGVGSGPVTLPIEALQDHEVCVRGTAMYVEADVAEAARLVSGGLPVRELVTAEYPVRDAAEAFAAAASGAEVKVQLVADGAVG